MEKGMFDLDQEKNTCRILLHFVRLSGLVGLFNKSTTIFHGLHSYRPYRNDVMKCSKLKWNYEPQASGFNAKF